MDYRWNNQEELEQLERLRSEILPAAQWLPILVIYIRSQVKTVKVKVKILKNRQKFKYWNFARNFTGDTPTEVVW